VLRAATARGLAVIDRAWTRPGAQGLLEALEDTDRADVVNLRSYVDPDARRALFRGVDAVLANSGHEPFGLVGLETMASGGVACTGCSGEDYAEAGRNAIVLRTGEPQELLTGVGRLRTHPDEARALRRAGRATARRYAWSRVVRRNLLPRFDLDGRAPALATAPALRRHRGEGLANARV
jgi:glycosyltransferase involved in cell wall biosynthesis